MTATRTLSSNPDKSPAQRGSSALRTTRAVIKSILLGLASAMGIIVVWWLLIFLLRVPPFVGKGPQDVWVYLFSASESTENRQIVLGYLGETLVDASIGFSAGLALALVLASLFFLVRPIEQSLMPLMLVLQSIPLIALAPIIILIFGRGSLTVAAMGALVVVFPALVTIVFGLRSVSPYMVEVVTVFGGNASQIFRKVSLPTALPALFSAIRIAVPAAMTGALVAEWLATGRGIGRAIIAAVAQAKMSEVWTLAAVVTLTSIVLYYIASAIESAVLARLGMERND